MKNLRKNLNNDIRSGTSLLEIVGENIDHHAELFAEKFKVKKTKIKKEIIKIVIQGLNENLERLCKIKN